ERRSVGRRGIGPFAPTGVRHSEKVITRGSELGIPKLRRDCPRAAARLNGLVCHSHDSKHQALIRECAREPLAVTNSFCQPGRFDDRVEAAAVLGENEERKEYLEAKIDRHDRTIAGRLFQYL